MSNVCIIHPNNYITTNLKDKLVGMYPNYSDAILNFFFYIFFILFVEILNKKLFIYIYIYIYISFSFTFQYFKFIVILTPKKKTNLDMIFFPYF